ncbi:MAG TPA: secondary thiamine-phosphate synthase enzyme YjbQ [Anaerohalosphaeraceae bacterium]|nr:secondary thiamine-phosphate synthase enzyme YjbQ [Anaerohalosphaeraceae bacterium]HOL87606.1 secondary thiamine-phosphate synthase enzyme YjbQ [Anaerohalosphaeraceae bacterium]HPP56184.1 secondary thiamine-phosphate synthase enzyme YjbQ [Anaerohalosphaeraceae bacterium]
MKVVQQTIGISTRRRCEMADITEQVAGIVEESGIQNGQVTVYTPHTTAGITINENADLDVVHDILLTLEALVPAHRAGYQHSEGNSDAHVKSSLVGCSERILLEKGRLVLGTWQGIYFCEFDGPRSRKVIVQVLGE